MSEENPRYEYKVGDFAKPIKGFEEFETRNARMSDVNAAGFFVRHVGMYCYHVWYGTALVGAAIATGVVAKSLIEQIADKV